MERHAAFEQCRGLVMLAEQVHTAGGRVMLSQAASNCYISCNDSRGAGLRPYLTPTTAGALLGAQVVLACCIPGGCAAPPLADLVKTSRMCCYAGPWRQVSAAHLQVLQALQVSSCHHPGSPMQCEGCTCKVYIQLHAKLPIG